MNDQGEIPTGVLTSYAKSPAPDVGERVVLVGQGGVREIGTVVSPANPQLTVGGIWVHSPSKGYPSHYAPHNVFHLSNRRIDELVAERDAYKESSDRAWATLNAMATKLGIDDKLARGLPGKPSDVFLDYMNERDVYVAAQTARAIRTSLLTGIHNNHIDNAPSAQRAVEHIVSLIRVEVEKRTPMNLKGS